MKIVRSSVSAPRTIEAEPAKEVVRPLDEQDSIQPLHSGDRIEYGVTHELSVDGDKAWVRYGVTSTLSEGESVEAANRRVTEFVNAVVMQSATEVAQQIMRG
jgi:hypothetical protein